MKPGNKNLVIGLGLLIETVAEEAKLAEVETCATEINAITSTRKWAEIEEKIMSKHFDQAS